MHLAHLRLRDFRNYVQLDADFTPGFHLLVGNNAQGKTNLLEAIYLLVTLRSFQGAGHALMVRQGAPGYFVGGKVIGPGEHEIRVYGSVLQRQLSLDGRPIRKLSDYLGVLRGVVFCTEDMQLIKGTARVRRRFLDLLLTQTQPGYLALIQRYSQALRARNALLKQGAADNDALEGFTTELVLWGNRIIQARHELVPRFSPLAKSAYHKIMPQGEELGLEYQPSVRGELAAELAASHSRERMLRTTCVGPHRDEVQLMVNGRPANLFGSEGQKRTLAIALKMAQAEFLGRQHGALPVLLIDDVMGELDRQRRNAFLPLLEQSKQAQGQVFMTCTEEHWPEELGDNLVRWEVRAGTVQPMA